MKNFYLDPSTYVAGHFSSFDFSLKILVIHCETIGEGAGSCPSIARRSKGARQCPSRRRKAERETGRRVASGQCRCRQILCRPNRRCQQNHRNNNNNSQTTDDNCCRSSRSCRSISNPQTLCHRQQVGQRSSPNQSGGRRLGQNFTNQINDVDFILVVVVGRQEPIVDGRRRPSQDGGAGQKRGAAGRQEDERR